MRTVLNMLKEKLNTLGYNENIIKSVLGKFDLALIESKYNECENVDEFVDVEIFEEPNVEIIQLFLNIGYNVLQSEILEGDISLSSTETFVGTRFAIADYSLHKRSAIIAMTADLKIKIIVYNPTPKVQNLYNGLTYEQTYKRDRDDITKEYYDAFIKNGRLSERRVKEILTMLVSDFVFDEMAVYDANPRIKLYDNEHKYAENLYSYSLRYINLKNNRIETLNKKAKIKRMSKSVQAGLITNDPYIKIDKLPPVADFPLNTISYYWLYANRNNQEEIGIFISPKTYEKAMYSDLKMEDPKLLELARDLGRRFRRDANQDLDIEEINDILKKLNTELMVPSTDFIYSNLPNRTDMIEPIKYKYKVVTDPAEFEEKLYVTIEDHVSRRYKYNLVENVMEDFTTIGNKLEYTDERGNKVTKQSIADFNVNAPAVIIRRETFIDVSKIPDLLGYIYEDMKYYGTDGLPVPNIEVVFYFPKEGTDRTNIAMYNGTSLDVSISNMAKQNLFNSDSMTSGNYVIGGGNVLPGSTQVTIKYLNSKGEILKENIVGNVFPNSTFLPDVIPTINDKDGKEWVMESNVVAPFLINSNPDLNVIEIKYREKFSRINISFINREGKKIADDKSEIVQVGATYDVTTKKTFRDKNGEDWKLVFSRPSKLVIKEEEQNNKIILIYDIERADIKIRYVTRNGVQIAESKIVQGAVEKLYKADTIPYIVDSTGLGWNYLENSVSTILVKKDTENTIDLVYEEAKKKVITRLRDINGINLKDNAVEFVQIGMKYTANFDNDIYDFECKEWILSSVLSSEIIVSEDESKNILEAIYEPRLARASIRLLTMDGRPIKDSLIENAQVGAMYNSDDKKEIVDNFGKMWKCAEKGKGIVISDKESENIVTLKYEPFMVKVTIKYFDIEMNELIPPKYETLQVGSTYKNTPINKLTDTLGRKWIIDESKIPTIEVKKYEEENIVSIYYNKETAKVRLSFYDAFNNKLRDMQDVESQIGAPLESDLYLKITDDHGKRWMMESSEPKNLTVRENGNVFKLIYGEVKAKVLIKHININTQKPFVEDIISTVKLGGIFVPNIRQTILDKNRWRYKYIGEENISIVTKENEQENIIVLTYDEDRSKVILKYRNEQDEKIREDAVKEIQIGKEIRLEPIQKFNDNEGLGWKYSKSSCDTKVVLEGENVIINHYTPLNSSVVMKYYNEEDREIISAKEDIIQVGKKYVPEQVQKITDVQGAVWKYDAVSEEELIVKEEINNVVYKYSKLYANVTVNLKDTEKNLIAEPIIIPVQVGTTFEATIEKNYEDTEGKAWIFDSIDYSKINVSEDEEKNIINIIYKKELVDLRLSFFNGALQTIKPAQIVKAQIGSIYIPEPPKEIIDDKMLGWSLREDLIPKFKVKRNPAENMLNITYDKFMVDVAVKFIDDNEANIIEDNITKHQVGTTFMPTIEDYIEDLEGKEWIYGLKTENKLFSSGKKVEPITVSQMPNKNVIKLHYKPSMNKVVIRYVDPLGTEIKTSMGTEAQIGSNYTPEIIEKIVGLGNIKWIYNPNSKSTIRISKDAKKNVVNLAYEEEKAIVIYSYKDEDGIKLKEERKELVQIGSIYKAEPENVIEGEDGRVWEYKAKNLDELKVSDDEKQNIIEVIYIPLKVNVALKYLTLNGRTILPDKIVKAQLGSEYKPDINQTIADDESKQFKFLKCEPETLKIKEIPIDALETTNVFSLTYEALFSEARIIFKDIDGNKLRDDEVKSLQVGTLFAPSPIRYITDGKGIQWELISDKIDSLRVKEDAKENQISMVYEVAKAEISVRYKDMDGNTIKESDIIHLEVGSEFVPEIEKEITDKSNKKWTYMMTDPVKLTVGSINNIINVVYQEKKVMTIVKIQTTDGRQLKEDIRSKQQVGSRYKPEPKSKVIYENNDLWRYAYNSPSDIIVSENIEENVIIQYYTSDDTNKDVSNNKGGYYNKEVEKFIDKDLVAEEEKREQERKQKELEEQERKQAEEKEKVNFTDSYLQKLEKTIKLTNAEKDTVNKLNDCNTNIIRVLHEALSYNGTAQEYGLEEKLNSIIREEKMLVEEGLKDILEEDKTGTKILKIFEAITSSEMGDRDFSILQQKKSILFADYFVNKNITDMEQVTYIIERGKNEKGIESIDERLAISKGREEDFIRIKVILVYEKAMLDNYYRARSIVKDDYFKNEETKQKVSREVMVMVTNNLPNQAIRLFNKATTLKYTEQNELDAIMRLLNPQQLGTVNTAISKIGDGKTRKFATRLFKELTQK